MSLPSAPPSRQGGDAAGRAAQRRRPGTAPRQDRSLRPERQWICQLKSRPADCAGSHATPRCPRLRARHRICGAWRAGAAPHQHRPPPPRTALGGTKRGQSPPRPGARLVHRRAAAARCRGTAAREPCWVSSLGRRLQWPTPRAAAPQARAPGGQMTASWRDPGGRRSAAADLARQHAAAAASGPRAPPLPGSPRGSWCPR
mmetsp:Transcript_27691/g.71262  ORF Transcript_27691/g.71262 Transcript_27691/m.71262 type:complete len:201 (-) Transcript_27691:737-1339(-)